MSTTTRNGKAAPAAEAKDERQKSATPANNRPVHEVRLGRIVGAVWRHNGDDGKVWFNVTLLRIYRTDDGNWARSDSFGRNDLPLVIKVADLCHTWMYTQGQPDE